MASIAQSQRFDITCHLNDLPDIIAFGFDFAGHTDMFTRPNNRVRPAYQFANFQKYLVLATGSMAAGGPILTKLQTPYFYRDFKFDYDPAKIAEFVTDYVNKQPRPEYGTDPDKIDGITGARIQSMYSFLTEHPKSHKIHNPAAAIFVIQPWLI